MRPGGRRTVTNGFEQRRPVLAVLLLGNQSREVEVVPAHDGVLDQPPTGLGDLLILLLALDELVAEPAVSSSSGALGRPRGAKSYATFRSFV